MASVSWAVEWEWHYIRAPEYEDRAQTTVIGHKMVGAEAPGLLAHRRDRQTCDQTKAIPFQLAQ